MARFERKQTGPRFEKRGAHVVVEGGAAFLNAGVRAYAAAASAVADAKAVALAAISDATVIAQSSQAAAQSSAADAELALQAQFLTQDEGVGALIGTSAGPNTRAAGDARWHTRGSVVVEASDYAVGDGVTDDTTALRAAITAAKAAPHKSLRLRPGTTYAVTGSLDPTGLTVEATGATIRTLAGATSHNVIVPTGSVTWRGGTIDLNKANAVKGTAGSGWSQSGTWGRLDITDLTVTSGFFHGFFILGGSTGITDAANAVSGALVMDRVTATLCDQYGVNIQRCSGLQMRGMTVVSNVTAGAQVTLSRDVEITGGRCDGNGTTAAGGHGLVMSYVLDSRVVGVQANNNAGSGVVMGGGNAANAASLRGTISGCTTRNNGSSGVYVDPTISGSSSSVRWGGTITGCTSTGNTQHGIALTNVTDCAISGNTARGNLQRGIQVNGVDVAISGNTATGNAHGIAFYSHGEGVRVGVNTVTGNGTAGYFVGAGVTTAPQFTATTTTVPSA